MPLTHVMTVFKKPYLIITLPSLGQNSGVDRLTNALSSDAMTAICLSA